MTPPVPPPAAVEIAQKALNATRGFGNVQAGYAEAVVAALVAAGLLDPDARLREAGRALVAALAGHTFDSRDPVVAALVEFHAALDAAPAETSEQLAARLTDRMRARDAAGNGEACHESVVASGLGVFECTKRKGHSGDHDNPAFFDAL